MELEFCTEIHTYLGPNQLLSISGLLKILYDDFLIVLYPDLAQIVLEYLFNQSKLIASCWTHCRAKDRDPKRMKQYCRALFQLMVLENLMEKMF